MHLEREIGEVGDWFRRERTWWLNIIEATDGRLEYYMDQLLDVARVVTDAVPKN